MTTVSLSQASAPAPRQALPLPHIEKIERIGNLVAIHFGRDANRAYVLQASDFLPSNQWTTLVSLRALPFADHYVAADTIRTNGQRFYRLVATP